MTNEIWGELRQELLKTVGRNNYVNWIEPLEFAELKDGVATFLVPTNFMGDWVSRNFGEHIHRLLNDNGQRVARVAFNVPKTMARKAEARPAPAPAKPAATTASRTSCTVWGWLRAKLCLR